MNISMMTCTTLGKSLTHILTRECGTLERWPMRLEQLVLVQHPSVGAAAGDGLPGEYLGSMINALGFITNALDPAHLERLVLIQHQHVGGTSGIPDGDGPMPDEALGFIVNALRFTAKALHPAHLEKLVLVGHLQHVGAAAVVLDGDGPLTGAQFRDPRRKPGARVRPVHVARRADRLAAHPEDGLQ